MSKSLRSWGFIKALLLAAIGITPVVLPIFSPSRAMAYSPSNQDYGGQDQGVQDLPNLGPFDDEAAPRRLTRSKAARKKTRQTDKASSGKADSTAKTTRTTSKGRGSDTGQLTFSQHVAPILVDNCLRCHSGDGPGLKKGKLDLSTFAGLQKGTGAADSKVISPGNPEESSLVSRIKEEDGSLRMPKGTNQSLSPEAIAKIERWVKQGAKLDSGFDPKKAITSYAANGEQVRRAELAKLPQKERDKGVEAAGLRRWKQANPKLKPDIVPGDHFVIFSNLPRERSMNTLKVMEAQHGHLRKFLGAAANWVEKVGIYVFASRKDFIEFVRSVQNRELEPDDVSAGMLSEAQPYVAVVDPLGGRNEEPGAGKRRPRTKRPEEGQAEGALADRTLNGLLTEALGKAAVASAGSDPANCPRWLALGIGGYLACQVEPRSAHYRQLRQTALATYQQGWATKANEALGGTDQVTADGLRAVGFALVEAINSNEVNRRYFPDFVKALLGGEKLDDALQSVFHGTREDFINDTGEWIAARYGQLQ
jgi:hypothetical protein